MTRIIAGSVGGRRIEVPATGTRPTGDRVREALFSRLEHLGAVDGARVLDLYAGSGALGLEAVSRGAGSAVLVEFARAAVAACRTNAGSLGLDDQVRVVPARVERFLNKPVGDGDPFGLVLADPPYDLPGLDRVLQTLVSGSWLAPDAVVVVERSARADPLTWPEGLTHEDMRRYGDSALWFARAEVA